jgi:hypothetical protein
MSWKKRRKLQLTPIGEHVPCHTRAFEQSIRGLESGNWLEYRITHLYRPQWNLTQNSPLDPGHTRKKNWNNQSESVYEKATVIGRPIWMASILGGSMRTIIERLEWIQLVYLWFIYEFIILLWSMWWLWLLKEIYKIRRWIRTGFRRHPWTETFYWPPGSPSCRKLLIDSAPR